MGLGDGRVKDGTYGAGGKFSETKDEVSTSSMGIPFFGHEEGDSIETLFSVKYGLDREQLI